VSRSRCLSWSRVSSGSLVSFWSLCLRSSLRFRRSPCFRRSLSLSWRHCSSRRRFGCPRCHLRLPPWNILLMRACKQRPRRSRWRDVLRLLVLVLFLAVLTQALKTLSVVSLGVDDFHVLAALAPVGPPVEGLPFHTYPGRGSLQVSIHSSTAPSRGFWHLDDRLALMQALYWPLHIVKLLKVGSGRMRCVVDGICGS
jgi:hypothetical protein